MQSSPREVYLEMSVIAENHLHAQVSFAGGRVIVATVVDGSSGTVELPGASSTTRPATAAIVTGFSGDTDVSLGPRVVVWRRTPNGFARLW